MPGVDGFVTNRPDVCLGIYVADCCAIFLVDARQRAIGLVHSGRQGTEKNIVSVAVETMRRELGSRPADIVAQLSPCIRPPWYEVDFAARIVEQCLAAGITRVTDSKICTASNPEQYYSYRREKRPHGPDACAAGLGLNTRPLKMPPRDFDPASPELMDRPQPVSRELEVDLENLVRINRNFGSHRLIRWFLRRWFKTGQSYRALDLCTASGDIPRLMVDWARKRGVTLQIDAVDFQPSSLEIARRQSAALPGNHLPRGRRPRNLRRARLV